jgi:hypothetical protein
MLDWFEFDSTDPSPVATLVAGLPVDDGALGVVVEPLYAGGAPEPGFIARLRGRDDDVGLVGLAIVRKYQGGSRGQAHHLIDLHYPEEKTMSFGERVGPLPPWVELDEGGADRALLAVPLDVDASEVARFVLAAMAALSGPLAGATWRVTETDAHHVAELIE